MQEVITNTSSIQQLIKHPEQVIDKFNLLYVNDRDLDIFRHKDGNRFIYKRSGKLISEKNELFRIENLKIPPNWKNVRITSIKNGHLQATGRDQKHRKQYRYHPLWKEIRSQTKFYKMSDFGEQLPKIRKQVDKDLELKEWSRQKVLALIIRLMEETHIRIGNTQYAKRNKTYGLSTMRSRHLQIEKDKLKFEFTGKKGKKHSITLRNKKLIRLVNRCEEIPGWELFKFYDQKGIKHTVDSSMVNNYLHDISGSMFTAKDFRTWSANKLFFGELLDLGVANKEKQVKKNILKAYDAAATGLGNSRNVCKKHYVHPILVSAYENGSIHQYFDKIHECTIARDHFSTSEYYMLSLIRNYTPNFIKTISKQKK
ncbi:DNA topoisomerase IB [uncultured Aquimarina sp.]|uniref:DNA topoisomerase IB n=1 Tax=uncultured Aquimarina sp. TaxID=575652 RepID=UPI0026387560|nr:DNA topoisomerase IB [uncultured Aquimarina sp.]